MKATTTFRKLMETEDVIVCPCAYDGVSAKIIERAGFKAMGITGEGCHASILGCPDAGLLTMTEMATHVGNIAKAVKIPVYADAESGYGNAINVVRTVREFERAGLAGLFIEDQVTPPRCGLKEGKEIIPMEEMIGKIKAALDAREDPDFVIIARTDAEAISVDEAIKRMKAYAQAGADMVKPQVRARTEEGAREEYKLYVQSIKTRIHIGLGVGPTVNMGVKDLVDWGLTKGSVVNFPLAAPHVAVKAVTELMQELKATGSVRGFAKRMVTFEEFGELVGWPEIYEISRKYLPQKR